MKSQYPVFSILTGGFRGKDRQNGVTLIEILVSILILSFGVLGVAALHTIALQGAQASYERTQAVKIAYETLDFIRAYRGNIVGPPPAYNLSQAELARVVAEAESSLQASNLVPCLRVSASADAQGEINVTVRWLENRNLATDEDCPDDGLGQYVARSRI